VFSTRSLDLSGEVAWNYQRRWVALTDEGRLRVFDLTNQRSLFETARPAASVLPAWLDPDTLTWRIDQNRVQTHKFDTRSDILWLAGTVRAQGNRLMLLPCRERGILLIDENSSAKNLIGMLRERMATHERTFVEVAGTRMGDSFALDMLAQASGASNGCALKADRALFEAAGSDPVWRITATDRWTRLEETGRTPVVFGPSRSRWAEGTRLLHAQTAGDASLDMRAVPDVCKDAATDVVYGHRIGLVLTGPKGIRRELHGCAAFLQTSNTPAAILAPER